MLPAWYLPKGTKYAQDDELERGSSSCEHWAIGFGIVVVVSVIVEFVLAVIHPSYDSPWNRWGSAGADVLIAVGIVGEVAFGMLDGRIQTELRRRSDDRVAEANTIAAQANKEAAGARERTAEIERLTAWRRIDAAFHQKLAIAFRDTAPFLKLRIEYQMGDLEALTYAKDFAQTFDELGIEQIVFLANAHIGVTFTGGVAVEIDECEQGEALRQACLTAFGVDIKPKDFGRRHFDPGLPKPNMYMFFGPKPPVGQDQNAKIRESNI